MPRAQSQTTLPEQLQSLSINTSTLPRAIERPSLRKPAAPIADSWDDNDDNHSSSDSSDTETEYNAQPSLALATSPMSNDMPGPPPPTPVASRPPTSSATSTANPSFFVHDFPSYTSNHGDLNSSGAFSSSADSSGRMSSKGVGSAPRGSGGEDSVRPEKTTQTAARMIAGALGVRAPKRTEEQKQYDRAARDIERKRREKMIEEKRMAEEQRERARQAVWEDG